MIGNSISAIDTEDLGLLDSQISAIRQDSEHFRKHRRIELNCGIKVFPGKLAPETQIRGICRDISRSGLGAIVDRAPPVGESMWLILDNSEFSDGPIHAQCVRCRLLPESKFEAGFLFLSHIDLPE